MNTSAKTTVLTLAICLAAALAGPVAAQTSRQSDPANEAPRMSIRYGDLDLTKTQGAVVLLQRIKNAAGAACGPTPSDLSVGDVQRYNACLRRNMDAGVRAVNAPQITALYTGHSASTLVAAR